MTNRYVPDPELDLVLDSTTMRALSHPLRLRLMGYLRAYGPATATQLAQRAGVNSGATSYHLRQLAEAGIILEDETRGNARDRWWKAAHRSTYFLGGDDVPEEAGTAYLHSIAELYAMNMQRAIDEMPSQPKAWSKAADLSDFGLLLTPKEATDLLEELTEVVSAYRVWDAEDAPKGARRYTVQLQAFLTPGSPETEAAR